MQDIEVVVIDAYDQPVKGAIISIVQATAPIPDIGLVTDDDGKFFLDDFPNGTYLIRIFYGTEQNHDYELDVPTDLEPVVVRVP